MRDSFFKRALVSAWFSAIEFRRGLTGALGRAGFNGRSIDYEAYWLHRSPGSVHPRFMVIERGIEAGARVLDVGCGDGALLSYLAERKGTVGIGLDVSELAVARAQEACVDARVGGLTAGLFGEAGIFDHVLMSEVVEHVADAETLVRTAWDLAGRALWLTFPNIAYFPHRLRLLAGRFPVQWVVFPGEHLRYWSVPDFREWLVGLGLPQPQMLPSNGVTFLALHRKWPNLLANQIVVRIDRTPRP